MQVNFLNYSQVFNICESKPFRLVPRLFLMPRVTLAKKHIKRFSQAHNGYRLHGFMPSEDVDTDCIYFDKEDKRNLYFHIYIPYTVDYINCVYHSDDKFYAIQPESEFFDFMDSELC